MSINILHRITFITIVIAMTLSPLLAEAKAGKGSSLGSRGSRTYVQPNGTAAKPMERSITPPPSQAIPRRPVVTPSPAARPPFLQSHPFVGGLLGGLFGAGLMSLLFGGHFFGGGAAGLLGAILQLALLAVLAKTAISYWRRPRPSTASSPMAPPPPTANPAEFALGPNDLTAFEGILCEVQAAWSAGDAGALPRLMTPEMAAYLGEQLREDRARGVENHVEQVRLIKGDINETWQEGRVQYATVTMTWTALDYTLRIGTEQLVEGDPRSPQRTTEVWTFVRRLVGPWQMSAIQQV